MNYCRNCDIAYEERTCPLCDAKIENDVLVDENEKLQEEIEELKEKLNENI